MSLQQEAFPDRPKSTDRLPVLNREFLHEAAGAVTVVAVGTAMTVEGIFSALGGVIGRRKSERQLLRDPHQARIIYIGKPKN